MQRPLALLDRLRDGVGHALLEGLLEARVLGQEFLAAVERALDEELRQVAVSMRCAERIEQREEGLDVAIVGLTVDRLHDPVGVEAAGLQRFHDGLLVLEHPVHGDLADLSREDWLKRLLREGGIDGRAVRRGEVESRDDRQRRVVELHWSLLGMGGHQLTASPKVSIHY